jgi:hypothetical protein
MVSDWLSKGNTITKIEEGRKTDPAELKNQWGRPRAKKPVLDEQPVDKPKKAAKIKK